MGATRPPMWDSAYILIYTEYIYLIYLMYLIHQRMQGEIKSCNFSDISVKCFIPVQCQTQCSKVGLCMVHFGHIDRGSLLGGEFVSMKYGTCGLWDILNYVSLNFLLHVTLVIVLLPWISYTWVLTLERLYSSWMFFPCSRGSIKKGLQPAVFVGDVVLFWGSQSATKRAL